MPALDYIATNFVLLFCNARKALDNICPEFVSTQRVFLSERGVIGRNVSCCTQLHCCSRYRVASTDANPAAIREGDKPILNDREGRRSTDLRSGGHRETLGRGVPESTFQQTCEQA